MKRRLTYKNHSWGFFSLLALLFIYGFNARGWKEAPINQILQNPLVLEASSRNNTNSGLMKGVKMATLQVTKGPQGEKIYQLGNIKLMTPKRLPQAIFKGNEDEGSLSFHTLLEGNRFMEFFLVAWANQPRDWKTFLPVESESDPEGKRTTYEVQNPQKKILEINGRQWSYERMKINVVRRCGAKDPNNLLLSQFTCPNTSRHFLVLEFSPLDTEKDFIKVLTSLQCQTK